jgi:protein gp37
MSDNSKIEWTDATWNPVRGCTKISPGCKHCYAETFAERFRGVPGHPFEFGFDLRLVPEKLVDPFRWSKSRRVFVNSMSDLFHDDVPLNFIQRVFQVMEECPEHTFQVLNKRPELVAKFAADLPWPPNVWMGTSVESIEYLDRVRVLQTLRGPTVRFLSCEPLLGPLTRLPLRRIDWVIVGGESGPGARPMEREWVVQIKRQCRAKEVRFFFKQWGGVNKKSSGRELNGRTWDEMPTVSITVNRSVG